MSLPQMNLEMEAKLRSRNERTTYLFSKRIIDITGSLLGILFLLPLFICLALLIKLEDHNGPIFFKQTRVGKDGKKFTMYKFRSMVSNAEILLDSISHLNEIPGAMFKIKNDPRITKMGRFIRKTSMDELPQLWNVLKGEMSLVGPRPPLISEVKEYTSYDMQRLIVTPGCTGLWQVNGRNSVGFKEMVEFDLEYIRERSLIKDIQIIIKTIIVLLGSKNAY